MSRSALLLVSITLLAAGCKKKPVEDPIPSTSTPPAAVEAAKPAAPAEVQQMAKNFERVYFGFDAADLNADSKKALDENATLMSQFSEIKLEIQGHADERGTTDYNIALGQKRADAVVKYLLARGISSSRVKSVSYGEERPVDGQQTETAWAMNRRAEFVITWGGTGSVRGTTGG